ncbi:unnamed protein product [Camellia sinensis]
MFCIRSLCFGKSSDHWSKLSFGSQASKFAKNVRDSQLQPRAKVESLLLSNTGGSSSSLSRSSQIPVLCKPSRTRRALIQRGGLSIRCEIVSEVLVDPNRASVSPCPSLSALEQLKASAADRMTHKGERIDKMSLWKRAHNLNDPDVVAIVDLLTRLVREGDNGNCGSAAVCDTICLQALSKRIHYGKFVAEAKFRASPDAYEAAIRAQDRTRLMDLLTYPTVEEAIKSSVTTRNMTFCKTNEVQREAEKASWNYIGIFKISNITGKRLELVPSKSTGNDSDMDSDSSDSDEEDKGEDGGSGAPVLQLRKVAHEGCVNRIRAMPQTPHICASWADTGHVQVWDFSSHLNALAESETDASRGPSNETPLFKFGGHKDEGYAIDWSPLVSGRLVTGIV